MQQFVSPGAWLCDITRERYEVKEKKTIKKVGSDMSYVVCVHRKAIHGWYFLFWVPFTSQTLCASEHLTSFHNL